MPLTDNYIYAEVGSRYLSKVAMERDRLTFALIMSFCYKFNISQEAICI